MGRAGDLHTVQLPHCDPQYLGSFSPTVFSDFHFEGPALLPVGSLVQFNPHLQPAVLETRPSALGMSDPVMESLEILGTPEFSNLRRVEGDEGEIDEKVVKKGEQL